MRLLEETRLRNAWRIPKNYFSQSRKLLSSHVAKNHTRDTVVTLKCGKRVTLGFHKHNPKLKTATFSCSTHPEVQPNTNNESYYNPSSPKMFCYYDKRAAKSLSQTTKLTVSGFQTLSWLAPMPALQPLFSSILHQKLGSITSRRRENQHYLKNKSKKTLQKIKLRLDLNEQSSAH